MAADCGGQVRAQHRVQILVGFLFGEAGHANTLQRGLVQHEIHVHVQRPAGGKQQQLTSSQPTDHLAQKILTGRIHPLQILKHQQDFPLRRRQGQKQRHRVRHQRAAAVLLELAGLPLLARFIGEHGKHPCDGAPGGGRD
ncbi:hypothetical protein SDC9_107966 [bioreactor metagenome]|uniref:Uncharacterized protein n=1 Tax=bioreactor metagenome TaxID=1076179 RepID=A0A645B6T0_9ZZZZ